MKYIILAVLLSTAGVQASLSKLEALGMIESGNNDAAVGSRGEVSRYQIKPHIWREYSASRSWRDTRVAAGVAQGYLDYLEETFRKRARREPTDFDIYVLWNAGPAYYAKTGFSAARVHPVISERARRYVNLREMNNVVPPSWKPGASPTVVPAVAGRPAVLTMASSPTSIPAGRAASSLVGGGTTSR